MNMISILKLLFSVSNLLAALLLLIALFLTILTKAKKSRMPNIVVYLPTFSDQLKEVKRCFWCGTLFMLMAWVLCSSSAIKSAKESISLFSDSFLLYAFIWAVMFLLSVIVEVIIHFIKTNETNAVTVTSGISASILYSILYFVLSFLLS